MSIPVSQLQGAGAMDGYRGLIRNTTLLSLELVQLDLEQLIGSLNLVFGAAILKVSYWSNKGHLEV